MKSIVTRLVFLFMFHVEFDLSWRAVMDFASVVDSIYNVTCIEVFSRTCRDVYSGAC